MHFNFFQIMGSLLAYSIENLSTLGIFKTIIQAR